MSRERIAALTVGLLSVLPGGAMAEFTAYNDLAGTSAGNVTSITSGGSGLLKDYASGANTTVTLQVTATDTGTDPSRVITDYPIGTDAAAEFGTIVNNDGYILYGSGGTASKVVCVFTGLDPGKRYTIVMTGARGEFSYTNRTAVFTISDVDGFTNTSSAGTIFAGPADPTDEFNTGDNTTVGYVARFTDVAPGSDGDMTITAAPGPHNTDGNKWYVSQLKLVENAGADAVGISPGQINTVVGKANQNVTVSIPTGSNAGSPVNVTLTSDNPAAAEPVGAVGGALIVTFPAGGVTSQIVPIDIGQAGSASVATTNDAGLANATLTVNVGTGAIGFMPFSMLVLEGSQLPLEVSISAGSNETGAVQVTVSAADPAIAAPAGGSGGSLVLTFAMGASNKQTINVEGIATGTTTLATVNDGGLTDASIPVESSTGFNFTSTADQRSYSATYRVVATAMNTWIGGQGVFQVSPGDIDPPAPLRTVIDDLFGTSAIWYPGIGNHEEETASDMDWLRAEYNTGNGLRTPLKEFTNHDGPAGTVETTYSWSHGNAYFIMLNEYWNGGTAGGSDVATDGDIVPQLLNWLTARLDGNTRPAVFVFGHEPAYPLNAHIGDSLDAHVTNRDNFWNLLENKNVQAYICGHTHMYSKYQKTPGKTWQIDVGNAGNPSHADPFQTILNTTVTPSKVRFDIWNNDGGAYHLAETWSVSITPVPQIALDPTSFTHTVFLGDSQDTDTFTVRNAGADTLNYTVSVTQGSDWLGVSPISGSSTGEQDPIDINYDLAGKGVGQYNGVIKVESLQAPNSPQFVSVNLTIETVKPDFDHDADVDQADFGHLQECLVGEAQVPPPECLDARLDGDADVDQLDFQAFMRCLSGSNVPADRTCDD